MVGTIGKSLILSDEVEEGIINPRLVKLSLHKDISRQFFGGFSHGGTMEILNLGILKQLPICLPPIEEQKEIVNQVFQLFNFAKKVEQRVNSAQSQVNNLTQSILAKAFRGELTAEWRELNQALITGENSAEALLKKIKLEREKLKPVKKVNKVKKKT